MELDINRLVAQSYDCANNMCGETNGVRAKISRKLPREIKYIPMFFSSFEYSGEAWNIDLFEFKLFFRYTSKYRRVFHFKY